MTAPASPGERSTAAVPRPDRSRVLAVLFGGVLMGALDIAIIGPALPAIGVRFGIDQQAMAWAISVFVLFNVAAAPLWARLSDRRGRRPVYQLCIGLLVLGSCLVAVAPSYAILLLGRAVQATGAGGIFPVASAVIADVFPLERRGRALGLIGAVFGIAFVLGPVLGGLLLPLGWQWLFLINLPLGILLFVAAGRCLPADARPGPQSIDWPGALLLLLGLAALAGWLNRLELAHFAGRATWQAFLLPAVALLSLGLLVWRERRAIDPVLPPALLASSQLRLIGGIAIAAGLAEAAMVFLPDFAVSAFDVSAARASYMLLPLVGALIVGSPAAGYLLDRLGARRVIQLGLMLTATGLAGFAGLEVSMMNFYFSGIVVGLGLASLVGAPLRYAALAEAGEENRGVSQGLLSLGLSIGQLGGAALIGGIVARSGLGNGFGAAMGVAALITLAALLLSHFLRRDRAQRAAEQGT